MISCGGNNRNNDSSIHNDTIDNEMGFHEKHISDLDNSLNLMMRDLNKLAHTGDADYDFAMMMKRHHQGSLDMAKCIIDNATNQQMVEYATKLRDRQLHDIQEFDLIIQDKRDPKGDSEFGRRAMGAVRQHEKIQNGTLESAYASLIRQHHRDAIKISEEYLKENGKHPKMAQIATEITTKYPDDIRELEERAKR